MVLHKVYAGWVVDRGYLGAAKLSGAYEPDGKISAEFLNETPSALLLMTTRRPFTQHTPTTVTNALPTAKLMTFHFQIGPPYCQVRPHKMWSSGNSKVFKGRLFHFCNEREITFNGQ
ncbi:unnamed protein product [Euphydryas editha]|uniref:Uncharacterized protein n=1 Tax=Euphydryas editha TaxID=104508 RepID=A0AAU9UUN7_EUPED|nr:unnamed protein product [Euphydryas editha]